MRRKKEDKMIVKLKKHIDIYDLAKDFWNGCQVSTLKFIAENYTELNKDQEFEVEKNFDKCYKIEGTLVNIKCFDIVSKYVLPVSSVDVEIREMIKDLIETIFE